jgi:predicted GH43/DUF377 family glycosyl hydrolase
MRIIQKLLLTPKDVKPSMHNWEVKGVINPAGIRLPNKKIVLFARVAESMGLQRGEEFPCITGGKAAHYEAHLEKINLKKIAAREGNVIYLKDHTCRLTTLSHLRKIILDESGFNIERISEKPDFTGTPSEGVYGVEDARITNFHGKYLMAFVAVSHNEGVSTCLAASNDLTHWHRKGIIFREQNKDCVIFPEKIHGKFVALHRPEGFFEFSKPSIWISYSPDLTYWGREKSILQPRQNSWETERIGAGCVPLKTKEGWLEIYHGVKIVEEKKVYSAGAVLLDLRNPEKVLARSSEKKPLFGPVEKYEKSGFINNVTFPTAAIPDLKGKDLLLYCGGADSVTSVKKIALKDILNSMEYY